MKSTVSIAGYFTENEKKRLREVVRDAESRTAGEIAIVVTNASNEYRDAEIAGGVLFGSMLSFFVTMCMPREYTGHFEELLYVFVLLAFIFFFVFLFLLKKLPFLKIHFVGNKAKERAVRERTIITFYEKGLHRTRQNTGILFYLSILERKVRVLADAGIYEKIEQETLNRFARNVAKGMRDGRACDALSESIKEAGEVLAVHFPVSRDDTDELPNGVIFDNR